VSPRQAVRARGADRRTAGMGPSWYEGRSSRPSSWSALQQRDELRHQVIGERLGCAVAGDRLAPEVADEALDLVDVLRRHLGARRGASLLLHDVGEDAEDRVVSDLGDDPIL